MFGVLTSELFEDNFLDRSIENISTDRGIMEDIKTLFNKIREIIEMIKVNQSRVDNKMELLDNKIIQLEKRVIELEQIIDKNCIIVQ